VTCPQCGYRARVTPSRKRYVVICAGCDRLFEASRSDQFTCSPACRTEIHRKPEKLALTRKLARQGAVSIAQVLRDAAMARLIPDGDPVARRIIHGETSRAELERIVSERFDALIAESDCRDGDPHEARPES
jgi:hypothetical protein